MLNPPDSDINNSTIDTDTVVSEDPLNWRTWAKYANPLEWFNGISSYQVIFMFSNLTSKTFGGCLVLGFKIELVNRDCFDKLRILSEIPVLTALVYYFTA